jgi:hypothetical protein
MNRVLSWPHTRIVPGLLDDIKTGKHVTAVSDRGMIRFDLPLGPVEMKFSQHEHQLQPGTEVMVWWKGGGFVCAPTEEVDCEERESRDIAERVMQARTQLSQARHERQQRLASQVDIVLPIEVEAPRRTAA